MLISVMATDCQWGLAKNGSIPWKCSVDMEWFKFLTTNHTIIMGSKTFDTIGKPLPNRHNIVITRSNRLDQVKGITVCKDPSKLFSLATTPEVSYVVGGAEIYSYFKDYVFATYRTVVSNPANLVQSSYDSIGFSCDIRVPPEVIGSLRGWGSYYLTNETKVPICFYLNRKSPIPTTGSKFRALVRECMDPFSSFRETL